MQAHNARSAYQALYTVFVIPALRQTSTCRLAIRPTLSIAPLYAQRSFSVSPVQHTKTRAPVKRTQKWDEEINAKVIQLVDPDTNLLLDDGATRTKYDVLNSIDRKTHRLVQHSPPLSENASCEERMNWIPVCRVVSKKEQYEVEKRKKVQSKERMKENLKSQSVKTFELNWAIDANDLQHRLDRIADFLGEGRRVEIVLAAKKRGRKATPEECQGVVKKIEGVVLDVKGATVMKNLEGTPGGFATMVLQGSVGSSKAGSASSVRDEGGAAENDMETAQA
ncbi:hypothetical protein LTR56_024498 [Elasticomyces elasticus]|nr:hypothetical protein LTR56_024498 [Elasticomyces elasticus]KAK3620094.1 hypothetical protein LTR22_025738 [Elasticomyces elasticus]KAK4907499.1 hypothetical protein LTR49_023482 [Elasticomyces elasticus]KAK5741707.1 hypothetical protein LTS12_024507 [Elasticomyces elasticus]